MENIFTKSENFKQEYCCTIIKVGELKPIEGADRIAQTIVNGESIVVRKDQVKEGDILIYAGNETELCEGFISSNNLFDVECWEKNSNKDEIEEKVKVCESYKESLKTLKKLIQKIETAIRKNNTNILERFIRKYSPNVYTDIKEEAKRCLNIEENKLDDLTKVVDGLRAEIKSHCGFFNQYGRVKMIRLKGIPSEGFLFSLDDLRKWKDVGEIDLEPLIGENFDTVDGELLVKAYIPRVKEKKENVRNNMKRATKAEKKFDRLIEGEFKFHYDTDPLAMNMYKLNPTDTVSVTVKIHGCVEKNTIVKTMEYGDKTIGEIVDNKINCHILARDLNENVDVYVPVDNFYKIENDGEWYEIELEDGTKLIITGNNPIWCPELQAYRRVDELNGDEKFLLNTEKLVKIKSIKKLNYKLDRYDLTVSSTNNFYANGVLIHNTSSIIGNVLVKNPLKLPIYKKVWNLITDNKWLRKYKIKDWYEDYGMVCSSRKVIKNEFANPNKKSEGFYGKDIWSDYGDLLGPYLPKGMTVYGEIFGYVTGQEKMIQKNYDYGCDVGQNKMMIYRITTKENGIFKEWNVQEVYGWTVNLINEHKELTDKIVPITILYHGQLKDMYPNLDLEHHWRENLLEEMKQDSLMLGMELMEPQCLNTVPREGIVLRIDDDEVPEAFKLKTLAFKLRESSEIDKGEIDMEMEETNY